MYKTFAYTRVSVPIFDHKNKNDISKDDTVSQKKKTLLMWNPSIQNWK